MYFCLGLLLQCTFACSSQNFLVTFNTSVMLFKLSMLWKCTGAEGARKGSSQETGVRRGSECNCLGASRGGDEVYPVKYLFAYLTDKKKKFRMAGQLGSFQMPVR